MMMAVMLLSLFQSPALSLPAWVVLLAGVGLLLLAMALGGWLALHLSINRSSPSPPKRSTPQAEEVLKVLPLAAALVNLDGRLITANAEASLWLETHSPPRLVASLSALARRVTAGREIEATQINLVEGRPTLRVQAIPLTGAERSVAGVLLVGQPADSQAGFNLSRLVAHELRTPLTAIVGHAEILESCQPTEEALWRRSRDFIAAEAKRLARLVEDLLALSRLEASPPLPRPINARSVAESALSALFDQAEAAKLTLTLDAPPSLPRVQADPDRLQQALVNLLDNAIKYTPAGGRVTLHLTSEGGYIRVEVSDTGLGIPPDDLPHLFEPLYRADSARHLPGTGLGLTIVRAIIEQHGASISVRSAPGQGTAFTFRLPIAR